MISTELTATSPAGVSLSHQTGSRSALGAIRREHTEAEPSADAAKPGAPAGFPAATYRLQFNKAFTFKDAKKRVPYLRDLGITHVYASPYFKAGPDSMHGYDICDHNELNPVIGSRAEYDEFVAELHEHGMGQIVDFVPNHMGIGTALNLWWMDVLENGPSSAYAPYFDIDWQPVKEQLENKVLLPILGDQYGRVLERGEFHIQFENGAFFIRYWSAKLPVAPRSYGIILRAAIERFADRVVPEEYRGELQSILTAIEHLPDRLDTEPAMVGERAREKEIVKRRLLRTCEDCPPVREAIEETIREIEGRVGDSRSFDALDALLNAQVYRLSYWRVAAEEINYRRFFDINELAAIRIEVPAVFEATHRLVLELVACGAIQGLRIDHVDGLWNPREYLEQLRERCGELVEPQEQFYLVVEKILVGGERLRKDWPVDGSTGYDFANEVTRLFVDAASEKALTDGYHRFIGESPRWDDLLYISKRLTMHLALASEVNVLGHMLDRLSEKNRWYRDFTLNALTMAVREVIACFPVYRSYVTPNEEPAEEDREAVLRAMRVAKRRNPGIERSVFNFLGEILLGKFPENVDDVTRKEHMRFVMKFQQCTGPVMAKGAEDTAFYSYHRLVALNEVGGDPQSFALSPEQFLALAEARHREHPHATLATSTHDTKLGEDVRTRIAAISEVPALWRRAAQRWRNMNQHWKRQIEGDPAPSANEEYRFYQVLLGSWPEDGAIDEAYVSRLQEYMIKAVREAKVNSSWIQPNEEWEEAVRAFVAGALNPKNKRFRKDFGFLATQTAQLGAISSFSQTVLKCTLPGVPDVYQGSEFWNLSLVDPDNRRPIDYEKHEAACANLSSASPAEMLAQWQDGRLKCLILRTLLRIRREQSQLFSEGSFTPVKASGTFADSCVAFVRELNGQTLLVIVPRLTQRIGFPPIGQMWMDTTLDVSAMAGGAEGLRDLFTEAALDAPNGAVSLSTALSVLPFAVYARA